ncbi:bifunctional 2-C-methyl-D-erythritol 4-phosphate cytidylyltransferase/2-C-methyl-D-erythritol 2,4-cyclodiphosphate synthase [Segnochrobactraceae bacterium EtOH-i3]
MTMPELPPVPPLAPRIAVLVVAAGRGTRAARPGDTAPKQYCPLDGRPVLARTLDVFLSHPRISLVRAVIHADDGALYRESVPAHPRLRAPVTGGATRQESVRRGLSALLADEPDLVLIHDGVRPFVDAATIDRVIDALATHAGAIAALPVVDTLKRAGTDGTIADTVPRAGMYRAQTPQGFRFEAIRDAHDRAIGEPEFTDDAAVAEAAGIGVALVAGSAANIKLTTADDLAAADRRLRMDQFLALADIRVGTGFDVHAFAPGDHVTLCGVVLPHSAGLAGHSDADVGLHALTDAVLGAIADGDIGRHFPPSDMRWKGAESGQFLAHAISLVTARGGRIAHLDVTLICEAPKIGPHAAAMRARIAEICGVAMDRVSVKATTTEKLGFTGRREGIAAQAVATLRLPLAD